MNNVTMKSSIDLGLYQRNINKKITMIVSKLITKRNTEESTGKNKAGIKLPISTIKLSTNPVNIALTNCIPITFINKISLF